MKKRVLRLLFTALAASAVSITAMAQQKVARAALPVFTADSLASGNYKDILTSFFQLAFDNLTGPDKSLNFNTNPFAVMLKSDPALAMDVNYYKYRALRKMNVGFGIRLDTSYRFSGFSSAIKYALINQRDSTTSRFLFRNLQHDPLNIEVKALKIKLLQYLNDHYPAGDTANRARRIAFSQAMDQLTDTDYIPFSQLDTGFQQAAIAVAEENRLNIFLALIKSAPDVSIQQRLDNTFGDLKNAIKNSLLWTVGLSDTTYKDQFAFSNIAFTTELSKGIFKPKPGSNLELDILASFQLSADSLRGSRNLKRSLLTFEPGINWVIRNKMNDRSIFEFKIAGSYTHNFSSLYVDERRDRLMFDGVFRVRVIDDIWIPLDFKYDPGNGHVFGFLSLKANFTGMGKLIKDMTK